MSDEVDAEHDDQDAVADAQAAADRAAPRDANEAARNKAMRDRGRQIGGLAGAAMAGAMIAIRDVVEGPPKDQGAVVVDAPTEPEDIDSDGLELDADDVGSAHDLAVPAQPRRAADRRPPHQPPPLTAAPTPCCPSLRPDRPEVEGQTTLGVAAGPAMRNTRA